MSDLDFNALVSSGAVLKTAKDGRLYIVVDGKTRYVPKHYVLTSVCRSCPTVLTASNHRDGVCVQCMIAAQRARTAEFAARQPRKVIRSSGPRQAMCGICHHVHAVSEIRAEYAARNKVSA